MVINPRVTCSNQNPYPMSFVIAGGSLLLQPDLEQHSIGHSIRAKKAGNRGKKSKGASQGFGQFWELFWPVFGELWWLIFKAKEAAKVGPIWQEKPAAKGGAKGRSTKIQYATVSQQVELITGHSSFKQGWLYLLSESSLSYVYAVGKQPSGNL
ncbi:hypothetical protein TIFTF001_004759 [Ficus carica]|uniref:Uncharacterized protein n=1 Tax=Ficus carica TaxID=3494 RepID=A0AA87ZE15_FICCA|nr:hypothetical protein TIFTF001_004759 [Ficus carica]